MSNEVGGGKEMGAGLRPAPAQARSLRLSFGAKVALLSSLLVVVVAIGITYILLFRLGLSRERDLVSRDRELAQVLAGLRDERGRFAFSVMTSFVGSADKVDTGLVYALELDGKGNLQRGALNPRLFSALGQSFRVAVQQRSRTKVLDALARNEIERKGLIKEYALAIPGGQLRIGFDLGRIDRRIARQLRIGVLVLAIGLLLGIGASVLLARWISRPLARLAEAMEAVASGDLDQTIQVSRSDELASVAESFNRMLHNLRASHPPDALLEAYLSAPIWRKLGGSDAPLSLPTEERAATVLSLRLVGLAELSTRRPPRELLATANEYLAPALDALLDGGAEIFALAEDRLLATWGAVSQAPDGELGACRAALTACEALEREARRQSISGNPVLAAAVGIASGRVAVGNTGSSRRAAFGLAGAVVAHARAAERVCPGGQVVITEALLVRLGDKVVVEPAGAMVFDDDELPLYRLLRTV